MMLRIRDAAKIALIYLAKFLLHVLWLFPVRRNVVLLNSFEGTQVSCNTKYSFIALHKEFGASLRYVWICNSPSAFLDSYPDVRTVRFMSPACIFYMCTCGVYITNVSVEPFIPKRKGQLFICSWHGGGSYKKLSAFYRKRLSFRIMSRTRSRITDAYISSCRMFDKGHSEDTSADIRKFLPYGMPRNDMLIRHGNDSGLRDAVKNKLGVDRSCRLVLYAPTVRGWTRNPDRTELSLDMEALVESLGKKFGGTFVPLVRMHTSAYSAGLRAQPGCMDVSLYDDMQELLAAADVLVTDYSSCVWDFALMYRPCFLFTPDLNQYEKEQGFHVPIEQWPFPRAQTNTALQNCIAAFDGMQYRSDVEKHFSFMGSYENGTACEQLVAFVKHGGGGT